MKLPVLTPGIRVRRIFLGILTGLFAALPGIGQPLTTAQQYAVNRAAVVMVRTEVSASVYVRQVTLNNSTLNKLLDSIHQMERDSIFLSPGQKLDIVLQAFKSRAGHYFKTFLSYYRHQQRVTATGTGFIFSSEGYLFTNCHVIDENDDYIRRRFILSAFNYVTETNISAIESAWALKFTDAQRSLLYQTFADVYSRMVPIVLENLKKNISVVMSEENDSGETIMRTLPARVITRGAAMPGKDVAILKIRNGHEFPIIPLSGDDPDRVGQDVLVYGYPDPVSRNTYLSRETLLEPTLTRGIISAWKKSIEGWPVIQMDAIINHGNSGGPVCNLKGNVIGITTFGSLEENAQDLAPGLNFAIPVSVLNEFIREAGISIRQGRITNLFGKAVLLYDNGDYAQAIAVLKQVKKINPYFPGANKLIHQAGEHRQAGHGNRGEWVVYLSLLLIIGSALAFARFATRKPS